MKKRLHKRAILLGLAAVLVVAVSIGGTLAWLTSRTFGLVNTFTPGKVDTTVEEDFDDGDTEKKDVVITNGPDANVPAFIRVALVPIWRNADGTGAGFGAESVNAAHYGMNADWFYKGGYYYYSQPVNPNQSTAILLASFTVPEPPEDAPEGTYYELQILAQSIQAEGTDAGGAAPATIAWEDVNVVNGNLVPKNS